MNRFSGKNFHFLFNFLNRRARCQHKSAGQRHFFMSKTTEIYQKVTDLIIGKLETAGSWQKLWDVPPPVSLNGHVYRGINFMLLSSDHYTMPVYGTFEQIRKNGGAVKKGEKSTIIVFWKRLIEEQPDGKKDVKYFLKYYNVFNVDQAEFDEIGKKHISELCNLSYDQRFQRSMPAENIINDMQNPPKIVFTKDDSCTYNRVTDVVKIPEMKWFVSSDEYYASLFHEIVHASGHPSRLNRDASYKDFNESRQDSYSKEELVAELGASFLCSVAGLNYNINNSAAYIAGWSKRLKENTNWIVWASRRAEMAADFILNKVEKEATV